MTAAPLILAIDQGTTNTKAVVFDGEGRSVAGASRPVPVDYPRPGWAEQSALAIWQSVVAVIDEVVSAVGSPIGAVAISNQRETIVVWDAATGEPIAPAILWQCRRSAERCAALRRAGYADAVFALTGLALDPLFPAAKIGWLLDHVPGARARAERGELRAGTVDSWLLWQLTGGAVHRTDPSNASRTQLFDLKRLAWSDELAALFEVPLALLPSVSALSGGFGSVVAGVTALPSGTPIAAIIGDSHAALYGHGIRRPGTAKATYGTGSSLMTLTPAPLASSGGLSTTIAWATGAGVAYALEGNISVSGQAAAFMAEMLGLPDANALAGLAATVPDSNGVAFVPALVGLGAPHWRDEVRGLVSGLSLGTRPAHLARAAIEAIAFQVRDVFAAMELDLGVRIDALSADGGASRNDGLMQFQADILGRDVVVSGLAEVSALGAARLAATGLGLADWPEGEPPRRFSPTITEGEREAHLARWHRALHQALA